MTNFEQLLLAKGDMDLICTFVIDYREFLSDSFKESFNTFIKTAEKQVIAKKEKALFAVNCTSEVCQKTKPRSVLNQMSIEELLLRYEGNERAKSRIISCLNQQSIDTVGELLAYCEYSHLHCLWNIGNTSKAILEECLEKIGCKLKN